MSINVTNSSFLSSSATARDVCAVGSPGGLAFVRVIRDCQWHDLRSNDTRGLSYYFYVTKAAQTGACATIAAGNLLALVIYSRLVRQGLDIQAHWYLLALALMEAAHQVCLGIQNVDSMVKYTGEMPYKQVFNTGAFIAWIHVSRLAAVAGDGLYAARNYWVLIVVFNRCRALSNWQRVRSRRHATHWSKLRYPSLMALCNLLFWVGAIVTWQLLLNRVSLFLCDLGQGLQLLVVKENRTEYWTVPDSENFVQAVDQMDSCLGQASTMISYLHLAYFTVIVYVPFVATVACCGVIWHRVRTQRYHGRYIRVRNILIIISLTFAFLETPILIIRIINDLQELLNTHAQRDHQIMSTEAAEVAEVLSSLHSLTILVFYLFADPTFRRHACRLLCHPNSVPGAGGWDDAWSRSSSRRGRSRQSFQRAATADPEMVIELAERRASIRSGSS